MYGIIANVVLIALLIFFYYFIASLLFNKNTLFFTDITLDIGDEDIVEDILKGDDFFAAWKTVLILIGVFFIIVPIVSVLIAMIWPVIIVCIIPVIIIWLLKLSPDDDND